LSPDRRSEPLAPTAVTAISLTANDTYLVPAVVLLESLRGQIPEGFELLVRDAGLGASARTLLSRQAEQTRCHVTFMATSPTEFAEAKLLGHWTDPSALVRLLPYEVEHRYVLDLDVDLLVRSSLLDLLRQAPSADSALKAVPGHYTPTLWRDEVGDTADLGIRESDNFFMGGVSVIDTVAWRDVARESRQLFARAPRRWLSDLSLLNAVCVRKWAPLEARWNVWTLPRRGPFRYVRADGAAPRAIVPSGEVAIAHFPGHFKPWLSHYPPNRWRLDYRKVWRRSVLNGASGS
jgi:lipopolysaccharide biosynthesis glycosyltransferase